MKEVKSMSAECPRQRHGLRHESVQEPEQGYVAEVHNSELTQ